MSLNNTIIHLEVELRKSRSNYDFDDLEKMITTFLEKNVNNIEKDVTNRIDITPDLSLELSKLVGSISYDNNLKNLPNTKNLIYHFYKNNVRASEIEILDNCTSSEDDIEASQHWILPHLEFDNLWESLLYDDDSIKDTILNFTETSLVFGKYNINKNLIACNRIILLHGPPGTGKTSLCKALAQKISIRQNNLYKFTHLIEINSHSLFSKWFSESGKLVQKLFSKIKELVNEPNSLVCVLIDEIESIAYSRNSVSNDEPKDSIRVVNAVLTQLDQIKEYSNILILATSNLQSSIDLAFLDRVDLKQFINYPSKKARYMIYMSSLMELIRVGMFNNSNKIKFMSYGKIPLGRLNDEKIDENNDKKIDEINGEKIEENNDNKINEINDEINNIRISKKLLDLAESSYGISGRTLRKIPFLAHAIYSNKFKEFNEIDEFLTAMENVITNYWKEEKNLMKLADFDDLKD